MERLFLFVIQRRAFFTFLVLELFCFWLIVSNNQYQGAKFFNSSNAVVASLNNFSQSIRDYFLLRQINTTLAEENATLRKKIEHYNQRLQVLDTLTQSDSALISRFDFVSAKVVNNQVDKFKNYITINKGDDAGLKPGMAVISPLGVVGKVRIVSSHYAVVTSILNIDVMVSAMLKSTGHFGTIKWDNPDADNPDPDFVNLLYIPPHVKPHVGDTVMTSGYNAIFPEGIMIGTISDIQLRKEALFYDLKVKLSQDFRKLSYLTVIKSELKHEQDSLEQIIIDKAP